MELADRVISQTRYIVIIAVAAWRRRTTGKRAALSPAS